MGSACARFFAEPALSEVEGAQNDKVFGAKSFYDRLSVRHSVADSVRSKKHETILRSQ